MRFTPHLHTLSGLLCVIFLTISGLVNAGTQKSHPPMSWTTLGTAGGPVLIPSRSQPANLLSINDEHWLIDCGDGCGEQLAATGLQPENVNTLFITHLHMDHIGGLQGLIGLRWMTHARQPLTIYGPPGTRALVAGLVDALQPTQRIGLGLAAGKSNHPVAKSVNVVELKDGSRLDFHGVHVSAQRNSHFDNPPGHPVDNGSSSLSYRFDHAGYSVGVTGDTGPDKRLPGFFGGVDLLVSEVIDLPAIAAIINSPQTKLPTAVKKAMIQHLREHHLSPEQAGELAQEAGVSELVFTHLVIAGPTPQIAPKLIEQARTAFDGEIRVAHDLERF
ncbi:MBL fold metallo-hydrolase [Marinobacter sp. NFXS9]|uniref:MBL fold metallo-hydrolase n=1 Tax=Marinobacter sp. NFXS9 TaxID=2818433 RepID=UPI0032DEAE93